MKKRPGKGRPLREWQPGELRRGYDRRHDRDCTTAPREAAEAARQYAEAMK